MVLWVSRARRSASWQEPLRRLRGVCGCLGFFSQPFQLLKRSSGYVLTFRTARLLLFRLRRSGRRRRSDAYAERLVSSLRASLRPRRRCCCPVAGLRAGVGTRPAFLAPPALLPLSVLLGCRRPHANKGPGERKKPLQTKSRRIKEESSFRFKWL